MYFKSYIDKELFNIIKGAEKELSKCFVVSLEDHSEEELRKALEKKMAEKQKKLTRTEQTKAKLADVFKEINEVTVDDESTACTASFSFVTDKGQKGRGILSLEKEKFFTG